MPDMKVLLEIPMPMAEVKEELKNIKKRDGELGVRAGKTEEYLNEFCRMDLMKARDLYEKIEKLKIPRLRDQHIWKIVDVLPKTIDELKVVLQAYTVSVTQENMKKIVKVVDGFA